MMQNKPYIFINRLRVTKGEKVAYDEEFHLGVNIIRGDNSSGKSSIMDFIFFALGGNISAKHWKQTSLTCDFTYIEVLINGNIFVFRRNISKNPKEGMYIFEGSLEDSLSASIEEWMQYPYSATANKESFQQNILKLLGIPNTESSDNAVINFHQILRLIYTDQLSSISRIFREEDFDSNFKRQTIGELVLGISDKDLYKNRLKKRLLNKKLENLIESIKNFLRIYPDFKNENDIEQEISENQHQISELEKSLMVENENNKEDNELSNKVKTKRNEINQLINEKNESILKVNKCNFEITDSHNFIISLEKRLRALQESALSISIFSNIGFSFCPSCFSKINHQPDENKCHLCGTEHFKDFEKPTYRVQKDIEFQIAETRNLIPKFHEELSVETDKLNNIITQINNLRTELSILENPVSGIPDIHKDTLMEIGKLNQKNLELAERKSKFEKFYNLQTERDEAQVEFNRLKDLVESEERNIETETSRKLKLIATEALDLLKKDFTRQEDFIIANELTLNFSQDTIHVDGKSNFSASSTAVLKSVVKIAILIASCKDSSFLYPRLCLMDNIEDKGMEKERSQNLQRKIVERSLELEAEHQIIFTTSMIAPELDGTKYCVGDFYTKNKRTLNLG